MGTIRIELDRQGGDDEARYAALDAAMADRGYTTTVTSHAEDEPVLFRLPRGEYWRAEPTDHAQLRIDALAAIDEVAELGAEVVATAGPTAFAGLLPVD